MEGLQTVIWHKKISTLPHQHQKAVVTRDNLTLMSYSIECVHTGMFVWIMDGNTFFYFFYAILTAMTLSPTVREPSLAAGLPEATPATNTPLSRPIPLSGGVRGEGEGEKEQERK